MAGFQVYAYSRRQSLNTVLLIKYHISSFTAAFCCLFSPTSFNVLNKRVKEQRMQTVTPLLSDLNYFHIFTMQIVTCSAGLQNLHKSPVQSSPSYTVYSDVCQCVCLFRFPGKSRLCTLGAQGLALCRYTTICDSMRLNYTL